MKSRRIARAQAIVMLHDIVDALNRCKSTRIVMLCKELLLQYKLMNAPAPIFSVGP